MELNFDSQPIAFKASRIESIRVDRINKYFVWDLLLWQVWCEAKDFENQVTNTNAVKWGKIGRTAILENEKGMIRWLEKRQQKKKSEQKHRTRPLVLCCVLLYLMESLVGTLKWFLFMQSRLKHPFITIATTTSWNHCNRNATTHLAANGAHPFY